MEVADLANLVELAVLAELAELVKQGQSEAGIAAQVTAMQGVMTADSASDSK